MEKVKTFFIILAIVGFVSFLAYNDYAWSDRAIKAYKAEGWDVVVGTYDNYIPFGAPWAFIKAPITRIVLLKSNNIIQLNEQFMVADVLYVDNEPERISEIFRNIYDCQNNKSAYLDSNTDIKSINFKLLKWHIYTKGMPGYDEIKKVCKFKK